MALVSHLLKHWAVATTCGVPWSQTGLSRDERGKPIFTTRTGSSSSTATASQPVVFNVSHQAGLVALIAATKSSTTGDVDGNWQVDVGTDIVCTSERRERDHKMIREKGWSEFVDMHAEVFGRAETEHLKHGDLLRASSSSSPSSSTATTPSANAASAIDAKLRAFYALWCYREAYVKMTGDALLASWLNDLEFRDFRAPEPGPPARANGSLTQQQQVGQPAEQVRRGCEIFLAGEQVNDANVCLRSLGPDFMTCSAVRTPQDNTVAMGIELGPYKWLSLEQILGDAETAGGGS